MANRSAANDTVVLGPTRMLIGGQWVDAADGRRLDVESPATKTVIASTPRGGAEDVDRAVKAAARAFPAWKRVVPAERGRLLLKVAEELDSRSEELGRLIAHETGNALRTQARPEAKYCANVFRYFGGLAGELKAGTWGQVRSASGTYGKGVMHNGSHLIDLLHMLRLQQCERESLLWGRARLDEKQCRHREVQ